jgi:plastocyanin
LRPNSVRFPGLSRRMAWVRGANRLSSVASVSTGSVADPVAGGGSTGGALITAFSSGMAAQQIQVAADPTGALKWDKATYEAQAGDVTFVVMNKGVSTHNFAVEGGNIKVQSPNFGSNTTNSYTLNGLKAGEYLIVCNFPGHREAGMVAKLIVR